MRLSIRRFDRQLGKFSGEQRQVTEGSWNEIYNSPIDDNSPHWITVKCNLSRLHTFLSESMIPSCFSLAEVNLLFIFMASSTLGKIHIRLPSNMTAWHKYEVWQHWSRTSRRDNKGYHLVKEIVKVLHLFPDPKLPCELMCITARKRRKRSNIRGHSLSKPTNTKICHESKSRVGFLKGREMMW